MLVRHFARCAAPCLLLACTRTSPTTTPTAAPSPAPAVDAAGPGNAGRPTARVHPDADAGHDAGNDATAPPLADASAPDASLAPSDDAVALTGRWRTVPGASRFAQPNAPRVVLSARADGPEGCGGGGCTRVLSVRVLRGARPAGDFDYFYSDRPGDRRGCFSPGRTDRSFAEWTTVEVAPAPDDASRHPACGLLSASGSVVKTWVILRVLTPSPAHRP